MAKIYETREDLQRDQLKDEAARLKLQSSRQDYLAGGLIGGGLIAQLYQDRKPETRGWLSYLATALTVGGVIEWVRSWGTSAKADALATQSHFTGTGAVVLPKESTPALIEKDCGCHLKGNRPKSLLEYAAQSASNDMSKG